MPGSRNGPAPLGDLLVRAREYARRRGPRHAIEPGLWLRVVGPRVARRATPSWLERGVLHVDVASAVWGQELSFLAPDIIRRLGELGLRLTELRFRVRPDAAHRQALPPEPVQQRVAPVPLPVEVAKHLERIEDDDLRRAIGQAAAYSLGYADHKKRRP